MTAASIGAIVGRRKGKGAFERPSDPVRAHSYDVDDARASPGQRIGDGSAGYGWAFTESLAHAAGVLVRKHRADDYDGPHKMQRSFVDVLRAVLGFLDYKSGELTASYGAIADRAATSESLAKRAVAALEHWGLLAHVRRSRKVEGAEGRAAPQREQASNAYYFDCRRRMGADTWQSFWSRVVFNLKKVGAAAARRAGILKHVFNERAKQAPRANGELAAILARIERDHFSEPDPSPEPSASPKKTHYPELKA